jgi:hypothetical protein
MKQENSCAARVEQHLNGRVGDLRTLWERYQSGNEAADDLGNLAEYGLSFDYVGPGTFDDQREAYFRYQLSWGGPSDEFRFFVNPDLSCHRIEYWFMDWFDGASRTLTGPDRDLLLQLWEWFHETGAAAASLE